MFIRLKPGRLATLLVTKAHAQAQQQEPPQEQPYRPECRQAPSPIPSPDDHPAIDIACRNGAEVRAAHDGVGRPFWDGRMGWTFQLAGGSGLKSSYSHLKTAAQQGHYKRGDVIGLCGNTGTWSTGTDLHFAMEPVSKLRQFHAFAPPLPDQAPPSPTRPSLLAAIEGLGIKVDRLERCGAANQLAVYHRGAQRLCIAKALDSNPKLLEKVVTY